MAEEQNKENSRRWSKGRAGGVQSESDAMETGVTQWSFLAQFPPPPISLLPLGNSFLPRFERPCDPELTTATGRPSEWDTHAQNKSINQIKFSFCFVNKWHISAHSWTSFHQFLVWFWHETFSFFFSPFLKGICLPRIVMKLVSVVWTATADAGMNDDKRCSLFTKHQLDEEKAHPWKTNKPKKSHCHEASMKPTAAGRDDWKDLKLPSDPPNSDSTDSLPLIM